MNSPNLSLTQLDPAQEQLIHSVVSKLLAPTLKGECCCHWLDAQKTPILLWKNGNNFVLKIATQKLIGFARNDKHGTEYWRFRNDEELSEAKSVKQETDKKVQTPNPPSTEPKPEVKKEGEWNKVESEEQKVQLELGNEASEAVNKFQAKYGTSTEPKRE